MNRRTNYRRKRQGKTNYKKRLKLLVSKRPRLVIRRSRNNMILQIIEYNEKGDKILVSATSAELKKMGWKFNTGNIPAAYLTGLLIGKRAKEKKLSKIIVDIGLNRPTKGSRIFAAIKGAIDAGIDTPHSKGMFPDEERISGKHISKYLKESKKSKQFSEYKSKKADIEKEFTNLKKKITG